MKINYRIGTNGQVLSDSNENSYSYDGHGNLVNGKDNSSTTVYDAYGNKTEDFGIGDAPFGYCGEYTDSESGFVYLRNRYYDPSTGSFITEDPIKDGNNWYGYCAGNPVNGWDPSGLFGENTILSEQKNNSMRDVIKVQQVLSKQKLLDARYTYGIYDEYTVKAVNLYKDKNKLTNTGECYGKVGKTTWEHMGLKIDNKYEVSNSVINGNSESDGLFASFTGMNIKNGLNIISGSAGLAEIKNKVHNMEFSINIGNINADVGATKEYVGADVSASLYSMGGKVEVPIPLTEHKLVLKGTGYVGGVGVATKIDLKNKKILVKSIAVIGEGVEIGVD
ncbi:yD repeat protein [Eubacterium sp. CAG:274]|nr:yD repeat protein [Eubacterium sp. CAG:274]